ncbi:hypothetical protein FRB94_004829 [Tulasnella sp. JGI-2019a]|nr:hypothetical protein FRB93_002969 [Tulasnella sp. JGI-2019a]KAG9001336.1 hypothetical protein FRB94_004829 [Tulasnella sp. JGI-2019a]KAG9030059.1 hypothetical protein FRB95_004593 [Tulasnella sp. JGI-2019a]
MPNCEYCGVRPVYPGHPYCGRTCAGEAKNARSQRAPRSRTMDNSGLCAYPGCTRPPFSSRDPYCGQSHDEEDEDDADECILCHNNPKAEGMHFCGRTCDQRATRQAPLILRISENDRKFGDIADQFYKSWRHRGDKYPRPDIHQIYKIIQSKELMDDYYAYRDFVEDEGDFTQRGLAPGNERRRWHGTRRACNIGDDPRRTRLCDSDRCGVCGIIRTSFSLSRVGTTDRKNNSFERFGKGIYASSTSSKAHDYSKKTQVVPSQYLSMLLTTVVAGEGFKLMEDDQTLDGPPEGFHCVLGEVGDRLNYDEIIVYEEAAIRPAWLVIYDKLE